jgi:predicted neutral ceramidase superfamily lipid hydrolase
MDNQITAIIETIEKLESRINAYWNFYTVIVVATVGWLMSSKTPFTPHQSIALSLALILFFAANLSVMRAATRRVIAIESELNEKSSECNFSSSLLKSELSRNSMPFRLEASYMLHFVVDAAVLYSVWSKVA